jgi:hypothetical protein
MAGAQTVDPISSTDMRRAVIRFILNIAFPPFNVSDHRCPKKPM